MSQSAVALISSPWVIAASVEVLKTRIEMKFDGIQAKIWNARDFNQVSGLSITANDSTLEKRTLKILTTQGIALGAHELLQHNSNSLRHMTTKDQVNPHDATFRTIYTQMNLILLAAVTMMRVKSTRQPTIPKNHARLIVSLPGTGT